jgi:transcription-repair coupling factor (superfamily II helicase)
VEVEAELEALIPESYVASERERLNIYRRLHALTSVEQLHEVGQELRDRFGRLPEPVETLLGLIRIRFAAARVGVPKLHVGRSVLRVQFPPETDAAFYEGDGFQKLMSVIGSMRDSGVRLQQTSEQLAATFPLTAGASDEQILAQALAYLNRITVTEAVVSTAIDREPHPRS